jgi:hypothetical protein
MVDEPRSNVPGEDPGPDSGQAGRGLVRGILGLVGLAALINYLFGMRIGQGPVETPPRPESHEEEIRYPDGRIEHPQIRYERRDVNFRWILGLALGAMVFAAFVHWIIWVLFLKYDVYESNIKRSHYPLAATPANGLPAEPRLEQPKRLAKDLDENVYLREAAREAVLASYGQTRDKGYVHIPIDRAMDMLAGKLPSRKQPPRDDRKSSGLLDAGEPNSGRIFREAPTWEKP